MSETGGSKTFTPKDPSGQGQSSMINPHNPEFLVKKPWYLGGDGSSGPTLDHQTDQRPDTERVPLSLQASEHLLSLQREKIAKDRSALKFQVGMWVEALRRNKPPYTICQIIKIAGGGTLFDLRYEDGTVEKSISMPREDRGTPHARIRITGAGSRALESIPNAAIPIAASLGKETYDSKRDKYHGFDTGTSYMQRMENKFGAREALRRQIRSQLKAEGEDKDKNESQQEGKGKESQSDSDSDYDSDQGSSDSDEDFVLRDQDAKVHTSRIARQGGVGGQEMKITARNLRIREDTAKYLRNLDPNSAFYDPKSRSMRDNPNPNMDPTDLPFAGDNFARISGDAVQLAKTQVYAWDLAQKVDIATDDALGVIHPQANPSQAELLRKKHEHIQADTKKDKRQVILSKYGGVQYLDDSERQGFAVSDGGKGNGAPNELSMDKSLPLDAETMDERKTRFGVILSEELYSRDGKLIRHGTGAATTSTQTKYTKLKSKYEEDIFINGHTTVFGSYFHKGGFRWGYADDHSLIRNSYCTGVNGRIANDESNEWKYGNGIAGSAALAQARELLKAAGAQSAPNQGAYLSIGSSMQSEVNPANLRAALRKQRGEEEEKEDIRTHDKKRGYSSLSH